MEFGKHVGKGLWAFADKALPALYFIGYVFLVVRTLPEVEFGNFVMIQDLFLIISGFANALALQPVLKYTAEESTDNGAVMTAGLVLNFGFIFICSVLVLILRNPLGQLLNSTHLPSLIPFVPALLIAAFFRNFTLILLQSRFKVKELFFTDMVYFAGTPVIIFVVSLYHRFESAMDLILINLGTLATSSIVGLILSRHLLRLSRCPHLDQIRKLWDYGKYSFGGMVSYMMYSKAESFILAAFTGPVQVAIYNSVKIFIRVFDVAAQVIQMFILPAVSRFSSQGNQKELKAVVEKSITFSTVAMLPIFIIFMFFASTLVSILYRGRYIDAIPLLQIFSVLGLIVPITSVAVNTVMGLGHARKAFFLSLQGLAVTVIVYIIAIPFLGTFGAAVGYVTIGFLLAWLITNQLRKVVPLSLRDTIGHIRDISVFFRVKIKEFSKGIKK